MQIAEDQIEGFAEKALHPLFGVCGCGHLETYLFEDDGKLLGLRTAVFNDEDTRHGSQSNCVKSPCHGATCGASVSRSR
jgi:hypothetical protein